MKTHDLIAESGSRVVQLDECPVEVSHGRFRDVFKAGIGSNPQVTI